ncbi:MAG: hypothetical protein Q9176_005252 [Flavoplaca citrina]
MGSSPENIYHGQEKPEAAITDASLVTQLPPEKERSSTAKDVESLAQGTPYSYFTKAQKRLVVCIITFAATFSPLSSFIFFPAINALSQSFHVSVQKINLSITSYMIVSGIAPAILGDKADMTENLDGAATIAIGYGVLSDIAAPSERVGFVGALLLG